MANNLDNLDHLIVKLKEIQDTMDKVSKTKSIERFGKDIQTTIKGATPDLQEVAKTMEMLKTQRDLLLQQLSTSPEHYVKALDVVLKSVKGNANSVGNTFRQLFGNLQVLFTQQLKWYATKAVTLNLLRIPSSVMTSLKEYNQGLTDIASVSRASQTAIKDLGAEIIRVATTTKYSVADIASAGKLLAQAGLDIVEIKYSLDPIAKLATATGASLQDSADLMITALRAYKYEANDAAKLSDIFANAVTNSKVTVEGLKTSFNYLASTTANLNIGLEDSVSLIGVLANSGQRLSTAATGLRTALLALTSPSQKMITIFEKYGITIDEVNPSLHSMTDILKTLSKLSKEDLVSAFSIRSANAILALRNAGTGAINALRSAVAQSNSATLIAKEQLLGIQNAWDNLKQTILSSSGVIGNTITNSITDVIRGIQDSFSAFNASVRDNTQQININFGKIVGNGLTLLTVFTAIRAGLRLKSIEGVEKFGKSLKTIITSTTEMKKAISSSFLSLIGYLKNPVFLAASAAIGAIGLALSHFIKKSIEAKQYYGNFLNTVDRQEVVLGKVIQAFNKSQYSLEAYTNQVKEAYKSNELLAKSLIDLERRKLAANVLKELNDNFKDLPDTKFGDYLKVGFSVKGIDNVSNLKEFLQYTIATKNSIEDLSGTLEKGKQAFSDYLDNTKRVQEDLKQAATDYFLATGNIYSVQALDTEKITKELQDVAKQITEVKKLYDEAQKSGDFTKYNKAEKELLANTRDEYKKFVSEILIQYKVLTDATTKTYVDLTDKADKFRKQLIEISNEIVRDQQSVQESLYITQENRNELVNKYIGYLKKQKEITQQINELQKSNNFQDKEEYKVLINQQRDLEQKLIIYKDTLNSIGVTDSGLIQYFSSVSDSVKLSEYQITSLNTVLNKLKGSVAEAEKYLESVGAKKRLISADQETIKFLDSEIEKLRIKIAEVEKEGKSTKDLENNLQTLKKAKQALYIETNKEVSGINNLVTAYKQITGATGDSIKQLIKFDNKIKESTTEQFIKTWGELALSTKENSVQQQAFIKSLGMTDDMFKALNKQYGKYAAFVYANSKMLTQAKELSDGLPKELIEANNIGAVITVLKSQLEGASATDRKILQGMIDQLTNLQEHLKLNVEVKNLSVLEDLQKKLYLLNNPDITLDINGKKTGLDTYLAKLQKDKEKLDKYTLIKQLKGIPGLRNPEDLANQVLAAIKKQTEEDFTIKLKDKLASAFSGTQEGINYLYESKRAQLEQEYNNLVGMINTTFANNKELRDKLLTQAAEVKDREDSNVTTKEFVAYKDRYIELYNIKKEALEAEKGQRIEIAKLNIKILEQERAKAVQLALQAGETKQYIDAINNKYNELVKDQQIKISNGFESIKIGAEQSLKTMADKSLTLGEITANTMNTFFDSMQRGLEAFVDASSEDFLNWKKLITNVLGDIYKYLLKVFVMQAMAGVVSSFAAPSGRYDAGTVNSPVKVGTPAYFHATASHSGGLVGTEKTFTRKVPVSLFDGAPRLHTGGYIKSNEVPTILKKGEYVLTPEQMKAVAGAKPNVNVQVIDQRGSGAAVETKTSTDNQGNVNIQLLIRDEVRRAMSSGAYDKTMSSNFGVNRAPIAR
jgi:TP901 family phage tail tape measure protein